MRRLAVRLSGLVAAGVFAGVLSGTTMSMSEGPVTGPKATELAAGASGAAFENFLDRLMRAESNGQDDAANRRSTALGPFQFIKSTFIEVVRRHFASEVESLDDEAVLVLRTNRDFARRAASAFSKENLAFLSEQGLSPTFGHLRLAFLVGPTAAARLLQASPETPVTDILGSAAITANPFMKSMSAADLIARADRDVGDRVGATRVALHPRAGTTASRRGEPAGIVVRCNRQLASCRRWISLRVAKQKKLAAQNRQKAPASSATSGRRETRPQS